MGKYKRKFFDPRYIHLEKRTGTILACILLWSIISFFFIRFYLLGTVIVHGPSMLPTLHPEEKLIVQRWVYMIRAPRRGEIVVLNDSLGPTPAVKRVVALPGEMIHIRDKQVFINDAPLDEPYLDAGTRTSPNHLPADGALVAEGFYFVLGDNRPESVDSREYGAVPRKAVLGTIRPRKAAGKNANDE